MSSKEIKSYSLEITV